MDSLAELKNSFPLLSVSAIRKTLNAKQQDYDAAATVLSTLDDPNEDRRSILDRAAFLADVDKLHLKNPRKTRSYTTKSKKTTRRKKSSTKITKPKSAVAGAVDSVKPRTNTQQLEHLVLSTRQGALNSSTKKKKSLKKEKKKSTRSPPPILFGGDSPAKTSSSVGKPTTTHFDFGEKENHITPKEQCAYDYAAPGEQNGKKKTQSTVSNEDSDMLLYLLMETPSRLAAEIMLGLHLMSKPETVCDIKFQPPSSIDTAINEGDDLLLLPRSKLMCSPLRNEAFYISWLSNNSASTVTHFRALLGIYNDHSGHQDGFDDWVGAVTTESVNAAVAFLNHFLKAGGYI
eukprot:CAMPEP_0168720826 /NCGR_PEP_ID=MMETSP0724-20121128/1767_1 /TAXON_ID=265536 /ORGANISM="Amphiprora sp., Strain CCMP467" /LENGTH=344 /DNA_ID=CAMNT_0008767449 /DNA_START=57 /DNA_END=1091 /DNA_ORIENTATION=-